MLAQVTDDSLGLAAKSDSQDASMKYLNNVITIMSCLEEKDKYLYYLSVNLSKRLLDADLDSINCMEWEKQLIHIIKAKLGSEFSKNLEAMIIDVESCYERKPLTVEYFKTHSNTNLIKDFHVNVLANCEWLLPTPLEMSPAANILMIQRIYEEFYEKDPTNLNKRLEWNYNLGSIESKFNWQDKDFILNCKPYQYFILQLFQHGEKLSMVEISQKLSMKDLAALGLILESLIASPKILIKNEDTGKYELNVDFKSKSKKVLLKAAKFEDKFKGKAQVDNERVAAIQGCIVRVMKSNKVMEYPDVVKMVEKLLLKFNPNSKAVRKEIDDLIKKEFLERDTEDFNKLRYRA